MVLCMHHNNTDYLIKMTLSRRGKHILWVQIQHRKTLSIHNVRLTWTEESVAFASKLQRHCLTTINDLKLHVTSYLTKLTEELNSIPSNFYTCNKTISMNTGLELRELLSVLSYSLHIYIFIYSTFSFLCFLVKFKCGISVSMVVT